MASGVSGGLLAEASPSELGRPQGARLEELGGARPSDAHLRWQDAPARPQAPASRCSSGGCGAHLLVPEAPASRCPWRGGGEGRHTCTSTGPSLQMFLGGLTCMSAVPGLQVSTH